MQTLNFLIPRCCKNKFKMKLLFVFSAAAVMASVSVSAVSAEVQLVGNLDASVVVEKVNKETAKVRFVSGFRHGSSLGLIGKEDLGSGVEIGFFLDQGFDMMSGNVTDGDTSSAAFSREAMLYVKGSYGQLGFGRFGTLSSGTGSYTMLSGWAFGTTYTTAAWSEFGRTIPQYRLDNAVAYVSPDFEGFIFSLMYSNGTTSDDNRWSKNNHYYGTAFRYQRHDLLTSLVLETADYKNPDIVGQRGRQYNINYGLEANYDGLTAMFAYQFNAQENGIKDHVVGISSRLQLGGGDLLLGARVLLGKDDSIKNAEESNKRRAWSVNTAYEYPVSKRTTLWGYAGYADGSKRLSTKYEAGRLVNFNGWQTAIGMTHKF